MQKRSSKREGLNEVAARIIRQATGDEERESAPTPNDSPPTDGKNPAAVALGRLGGLRGGNARRDALTPERRREIAKQAAEKRWSET